MLLIYSEYITKRLQYIVAVVCSDIGLSENHWRITNDIAELNNFEGLKINYSSNTISGTYQIVPTELLFQNNIEKQIINCTDWNQLPVFFSSSNGDLPFDIFAAAFYLITRYEEYLPHEKDKYGRFAYHQSIAYQHGFLQKPLINYWVKEWLTQPFWQPILQHIQPQAFTFIPTYDVDIAFCYQNHSILKNVYGFFRDFVKGNFDQIVERSNVLAGNIQDPYDVFEWIDTLHQQNNVKAIFFYLLASKRKGYDKQVLPSTRAMQNLLQKHHRESTVGIHPSWQSNNDISILRNELNTFNKTTAVYPTKSRQHYLNMELPKTYETLEKLGITDDYTMGYAQANGFRASFAKSFRWFNLAKNEISKLQVHPFCFMDATSIFEQQQTAEQALDELLELYEQCKVVNGICITIFHNHFLANQPEWYTWRNMYSVFLNKHQSTVVT